MIGLRFTRSGAKDAVIISDYMPYRGKHGPGLEFSEHLDLLYELVAKLDWHMVLFYVVILIMLSFVVMLMPMP